MTFGQHWATDTGEEFPAAPSLGLDFSFDPALIDSLPESIPDFFLVHVTQPDDITNNLQPSQQNQQHPLQQTQVPQTHMLNTPQPESTLIPSSTGSHSLASPAASSRYSPSDESPRATASTSRSGAGRKKREKSPVEDPDTVLKRQRNTLAARKYRQKRLDRISELEDALKDMTAERDDLKLKLARQEAETAALREMMKMKSGSGSGSGSTSS